MTKDFEARLYNVWARTGNQWDAVLNVSVTKSTAETLANLLHFESKVPYDDYRFAVSIGRPSSYGFSAEPKTVTSNQKILQNIKNKG